MNNKDLERLAAFSDSVRESTLKRLVRVPEGEENSNRPDGAMSPADLADHLIQIDEALFQLLDTKFKYKNLGYEGQKIVEDRKHFLALIEELKELKSKRRNFILELDDEKLSTPINFDAIAGSGEMDFGQMLYMLIDHEIHHRGGLVAFHRILNSNNNLPHKPNKR